MPKWPADSTGPPAHALKASAAASAAEYVAVVTELFFERPHALEAEVPAVYRELADLYRLQPLCW